MSPQPGPSNSHLRPDSPFSTPVFPGRDWGIGSPQGELSDLSRNQDFLALQQQVQVLADKVGQVDSINQKLDALLAARPAGSAPQGQFTATTLPV